VLTRDGPLEQALRDDARWRGVTNQRERAEIFEDYTRDLRVREKREREESKTKHASAFRACLIDAGATSETTWRKIYEVVKDDPRCERCEPLARLDAFERLVRDLEREEVAKLAVERKAKAREERKRREDFVELLAESQDDGIITPRMPWKSFVKRIENDERYLRLCQNINGSRPRELFEDLIDEIEDEIDRKLDDFEDLLRDGYKARELHGDTTWEKAEKLYRHDAAWKEAPRDEARKLFVKFIAKVFRREQEKERLKREGARGEDDERASSHKKSRRDRSASR
jgi:pre-mRNA-processing factor 40